MFHVQTVSGPIAPDALGHSQIHEFTRDRSVLPDFAVHRRQQILRHAHLCPLIRTLEHLPEAV